MNKILGVKRPLKLGVKRPGCEKTGNQIYLNRKIGGPEHVKIALSSFNVIVYDVPTVHSSLIPCCIFRNLDNVKPPQFLVTCYL